MNFQRTLILTHCAVAAMFLLTVPVMARDTWSDKGEKVVAQKRESLIWNVNSSVKVIRVTIKEGTPIINTVKILGGEEFIVGARFGKGQKWEIQLAQGTNVGQLRVNVDSAQGSVVGLTLKEGAGPTDGRTPGRIY